MPPLEKGEALSFTAEGIKKKQVKEENQGDSGLSPYDDVQESNNP